MDKLSCPVLTVGIVLVVSIVLFACSWDTVEPTEYGIVYNSLTKSVDTSYSKRLFHCVPSSCFFVQYTKAEDTLCGLRTPSSSSQLPKSPSNSQTDLPPGYRTCLLTFTIGSAPSDQDLRGTGPHAPRLFPVPPGEVSELQVV